MKFGKNRVQYQDFYWSFYRYERYDIYFNQYGKELAAFVSNTAASEIERMENYFDYTLEKRIIFIVFNNQSEFRQTNIGLVTGKDDYNIGGVTQISKNKVFLYFEGDHEQLEQQIRATIAQVVINEMLYGYNFRDNVANSTLLDVPDWYNKGLIAYLSEGWSFKTDSKLKDGLLNGKFHKLNHLVNEDAVIAGQSLWRYIAITYGDHVIPNIIYLTRMNKKYALGFLYSLGVDLKQVSADWENYYLSEYSEHAEELNPPPANNLLKRTKKNVVYSQVKINPVGKYYAYVTNNAGRYKVWVYNQENGKKNTVFRDGHKIVQIIDRSFPVLAWHPNGRILTFITEEEGGLKLYFYTVYNQELRAKNLLYFEKVTSYAFSPDGTKLVISGVRNGKSDIYIHTLASSTNKQITNDIADDKKPSFINNGNDIIFSSNRITNSLTLEESVQKFKKTYDLFIYRGNSDNDLLFRLNEYDYSNEYHAHETDKNQYISLTDENGIVNLQLIEFDSTIAYIDTAIHYRYYANTSPLTNYAYNISDYDYRPTDQVLAEIIYFNNKYNISTSTLDTSHNVHWNFTTKLRRKKNRELSQIDSITNIRREIIPINEIQNNLLVSGNDTLLLDDGTVDINNYLFEKEKINYYNNKVNKLNLDITFDTTKTEKKIRIYQPTFYVNHLVNQVSFSFLNESYQVFSGEDAFFNPGFNLLQKAGANDLFEDYKLIAGLGFTPDFSGVEYLLSFENLKQRTDHQYVYHRQKLISYDPEFVKTISDHLFYVRRYPFSQVSAIIGTASVRLNQIVYLPIDNTSLLKKDRLKAWGGIKTAYVFDNTRTLGTNLHEGTRLKVFGEAYKQINRPYNDLYVLGFDVRNYLKLHRVLILANRLAASTSFGSSPLVYFLGGVDNWLPINGLFRRYANFQQFTPYSEVPIDQEKNYAYRTLATNMRGFPQNIRNGNNFFVLNNEIRWPIFRYLANHPISSNMINNFQVVGFFDVGSAWTGLTPFSGNNAWGSKVIDYSSYGVVINVDTNKAPIVYGYGLGFRTQLLGYFVRLDFAWGVENNVVLPMLFYLSFNLDF